jgi:cyclohexanecarboxyl-CoA dehydrogenase
MKDKKQPFTRESAMTKFWAPQIAFNVVNDCIQNRGAVGFTTETLDEYRLREIRGAMIGDGTSDIMKMIVARELLGREFIPYR